MSTWRIFLLMPFAAACLAQEPPAQLKSYAESLRGSTTMRVDVSFNKTGQDKTFQPYVERRAQDAGIVVDNRQNFFPCLHIHIDRFADDGFGLKQLFVYAATLFFERAFIDTDHKVVRGFTYLSEPKYGYAGILVYNRSITDNVRDLVDDFLRDWRSVNP